MTDAARRQRDILICLCLVLATAAVYWPVRHYEFTNYDDGEYVSENPHVLGGPALRNLAWAFTTHHANNWHPLTWISHMLDCQWFGPNAGSHHLVNVLFHIANTMLLFTLLKRMTGAPWRSGFVSALFALHPLHVESVAWVAERKDVLSAFFWMLTMWAYVRYVEEFTVHSSQFTVHASTPNVQRSTSSAQRLLPKAQGSTLPAFRLPLAYYGLALVCFTLGLMSKPMVVTLPFVLLLLDYWPLGRTRWAKPAAVRTGPAGGANFQTTPGRLLREKLPFFALAAASCVLTCWAERGAVQSLGRLPVGDRIGNAAVSYLRYLGKAVWPGGLAAFYPYRRCPVDVVAWAGAVLILITAWTIWRARREPQFVVGWLWYLGTLVPVIGLVQVGSQSMADRYTYLPLVGVFMMAAWSIPRRAVAERVGRTVTAAVAVLLLGICAVLSRLQVGYWRNAVTLFGHTLAVTKNNHVAHLNLGSALARQGKIEEAMPHFEQALRIQPHDAEVHFNLGLALLAMGKTPEGMEHIEQAVRIRPNDASRQYGLANLLIKVGKVPEAIGHYEQALQLKPDFVEAQFNLGLALEQTGRVRQAIGHYEEAVRIKPDHAEAQNNLAWLLATLGPAEGGDPARAVTLAQRACELAGNRAAPYLDTLAAAYAAVGRFDEAVATAQKAIELGRAAGQPQVVKEIETRLELYRSRQAYRR